MPRAAPPRRPSAVLGDAHPGPPSPPRASSRPGPLHLARRGREDLVDHRDLGRVDAGPADEAEPAPCLGSRRRSAVEVAEVRSRPGATGGAMPAARGGEHDVRARRRAARARPAPGVMPEVGARGRPRRSGAGAPAGPAAISRASQHGARRSPAAASRRRAGRRADGEQAVERRRSSSPVSRLGEHQAGQRRGSAGQRAHVGLAQRARVDPHPDADGRRAAGRRSQATTAARASSLPAGARRPRGRR